MGDDTKTQVARLGPRVRPQPVSEAFVKALKNAGASPKLVDALQAERGRDLRKKKR